MKEYGWTIKECYEQNYEDLCRLIINSEKEEKKQSKPATGKAILSLF